jgi:SPP1 family predicted phage head-tail adaptor
MATPALMNERDLPARAAAEYDQRVVIEVNNPTTDPSGQPIENWSEKLCTRSAQVITRDGREVRMWMQLQAQVSHVVRLRACLVTRTITARHRVRWINTLAGGPPGQADRILNIESVNDVNNRHVEIELRCIENQLPPCQGH